MKLLVHQTTENKHFGIIWFNAALVLFDEMCRFSMLSVLFPAADLSGVSEQEMKRPVAAAELFRGVERLTFHSHNSTNG